MNSKLYKFYMEYYTLDKIKSKNFKKEFAFLIYDEKDYYYFLDDNILENSNVSSILKFSEELENIYDIYIVNFYPICICNNTIVIALRIKSTNCKLAKIYYKDVDKKYTNIVNYHIKKYGSLFISNDIRREMSMSEKYIKRYIIHEKIIKKYILTDKKRKKKEFKNLLHYLIPEKNSIIDVSCGDNSDVFEIASKMDFKTIVGNDISINYFKEMKSKNIIFTNENVEMNNFKDNSFDVSYCKNTLHHMNNLTNINNILNFLKRISKEIIIIEIEDPTNSKGLPKFLNKYLYSLYLKDAGKCYLNSTQFKDIIYNVFDDEKKYKIEYGTFKNILGTYMIAKIVRR